MGDKSRGYIHLYRSIWENPLWADESEKFDNRSAFIDLILMANHDDKEIMVNGCVMVVHRGQKFSSIRKLSKRWHWSENKVLRYIKLLKKLGIVYSDSTHNGTLLTIVNYDFYQSSETHKNEKRIHEQTHQSEHERMSGRQTNNTLNTLDTLNTHRSKEIEPPSGGGEWQ